MEESQWEQEGNINSAKAHMFGLPRAAKWFLKKTPDPFFLVPRTSRIVTLRTNFSIAKVSCNWEWITFNASLKAATPRKG
jgi:hypothetical protein